MRDIIFPATTGMLCARLRAALSASPAPYASGAAVQPKLPAKRVQRMVTVRDDSGPDDGPQTRRRYGFNVWGSSPVEAEGLALLCMAILRSAADGKPITLVDQLSGPYEIEDDPKMVVANKELTHYFFTARVTARGKDF